jgi:hypothetical protein
MAVDYSKAEGSDAPTNLELSEIVELAREQFRMEQRLLELKKQMEDASTAYTKMRTETLPEAMKTLGVSELALNNGAKIVIVDDINVNIKEENRPKAYEWMRGHGHGDIIKNQITMLFPMGTDTDKDVAVDFAEANGFEYTLKEAIPPQTLKAWAKAQLEIDDEGVEPIPEDIINIFRLDISKVVLPKERKPRKKKD